MGLVAPCHVSEELQHTRGGREGGVWATTIPCSCSVWPHCSLCNVLLSPAEPWAGLAGAQLSLPSQRACLLASTGSGDMVGDIIRDV